MDTQVLEFQKWMNTTYKNHIEWHGSPEDGTHGGSTVFSMIQALQAEIGYDNLSGNFGDGTLNNVPLMTLGREFDNFTVILKGSLWRAGYEGGHLSEKINSITVSAIKKLQKDIGIPETGVVDGYLWKALMTTDGYVTTWSNGSELLRRAQQELNRMTVNGYHFAKRYLNAYLPCDGLGGRRLSSGIILLIQASIGYSPSEATGNLGPATQKALPTIPGGNADFTKIAAIALLSNGYDHSSLDGHWTTELSNVVKEFQRDLALDTSGVVDFSTWMALLISHGNKNRPFSGCDTRFEITEPRLEKLKKLGITSIGRYINGTDFKILRENEANLIINSGLKLIPIYQESGLSSNDFSYEIGKTQAGKALVQLEHFGIPYGSLVYFAVDYDALDEEISKYIIPYFKGINNGLPGYNIGIYGTRNVCNRVITSGFAERAYVSNMSSGYSGNLGFKMPSNWSYDQFDEISIDDWAIDKVSVSSMETGVSYLVPGRPFQEIPELPNPGNNYSLPEKQYPTLTVDVETIVDMIKEMEDYYLEINPEASPMETMKQCLNCLRKEQYDTATWNEFLGFGTFSFLDEIKRNKIILFHKIAKFTSSEYHISDDFEGMEAMIGLGHLSATILGYINSSFKKSWSGWVGDFASVYNKIKDLYDSGEDLQKTSDDLIGSSRSMFNYSDFIADIDADQLVNRIPLFEEVAGNNILSSMLHSYYHLTPKKFRYDHFINVMVGSKSHSFKDIYIAVNNTLNEDKAEFAIVLLSRRLFLDVDVLNAMISSTANYVLHRSLIDN